MILTSASFEDVYILLVFSGFKDLAFVGNLSVRIAVRFLMSLALGAFVGFTVGFIYIKFIYSTRDGLIIKFRNSCLLIAAGVMLYMTESYLENHILLSGLFTILVMSSTIAYF